MRNAAIAAILALGLAGCAGVTGSSVPECDDAWAELDPAVAIPAHEGEAISAEVVCLSEIDDRRVRIGVVAPAGPSCHRLSAVEIEESADAVSVRASVEVVNDPLAGACPDEPIRIVTEADLQAPVGDRVLLAAGS